MKFIIIFVLCANILMRLGRLKVNFASAFGFLVYLHYIIINK